MIAVDLDAPEYKFAANSEPTTAEKNLFLCENYRFTFAILSGLPCSWCSSVLISSQVPQLT